MAAEGVLRKRNGWGDQHSVRVRYDGTLELEVPERWYQKQGWQPPVEQLPWADEAGGAKPSGESAAPAPAASDSQDSSKT